jgi:hypothetical protein
MARARVDEISNVLRSICIDVTILRRKWSINDEVDFVSPVEWLRIEEGLPRSITVLFQLQASTVAIAWELAYNTSKFGKKCGMSLAAIEGCVKEIAHIFRRLGTKLCVCVQDLAYITSEKVQDFLIQGHQVQVCADEIRSLTTNLPPKSSDAWCQRYE